MIEQPSPILVHRSSLPLLDTKVVRDGSLRYL